MYTIIKLQIRSRQGYTVLRDYLIATTRMDGMRRIPAGWDGYNVSQLDWLSHSLYICISLDQKVV